jgi:hypothetical protein
MDSTLDRTSDAGGISCNSSSPSALKSQVCPLPIVQMMHVAKTHSTHACTHHAHTHEQLDEAEDLLEQWRAERRVRQASAGSFRVSLEPFLHSLSRALAPSFARSLSLVSLSLSLSLSLLHVRSLSLSLALPLS